MPFLAARGQQIFLEYSSGNGVSLLMMHGFLIDQSLWHVAAKALIFRGCRHGAFIKFVGYRSCIVVLVVLRKDSSNDCTEKDDEL